MEKCKQNVILFDLDGTLTDSGEGIINCASLALEKLGLPVPDRENMRVFVGPPLRESFPFSRYIPRFYKEATTVLFTTSHFKSFPLSSLSTERD